MGRTRRLAVWCPHCQRVIKRVWREPIGFGHCARCQTALVNRPASRPAFTFRPTPTPAQAALVTSPTTARLITTLAGRFGYSWHEVEDLIQEGYLELWQEVWRFNPIGSAKWITWAYRVVRHHIQDRAGCRTRARANHTPLRDRARPFSVLDYPVDPASRDPGFEAIEVADLLAVLDGREQAILRRSYGIGRPAQLRRELAAAMGLSEPTIQRRKAIALDRLRAELEPSGHD